MGFMRSQKNVPEQLKLADFADKSLLILDDDDPLRGRLARAMEKKGFQVKEAKTVAEGLNIAKTASYSLCCGRLKIRRWKRSGRGKRTIQKQEREQNCNANGLRDLHSCSSC